MPSTVVDGGDGDPAVFAALVLCILLLRVSGFVLSFSFSFSFSFSSSPPGSEPKGIVTYSNALLLGPVRPCSLRGGFRGQSLHRLWPHVEQFDSLRWSEF